MAGAHARTPLRHVQVFRFLHVLCITSRQCLEGAGRTPAGVEELAACAQVQSFHVISRYCEVVKAARGGCQPAPSRWVF